MAALSSIDSGLPFGDFRALIERLPPLDERAAARVRDDFGYLEKPKGSLGRLEKVAAWLAASTGRPPAVLRPVVAVFAGNHGIARHDVSPRPVEATRRFVELGRLAPLVDRLGETVRLLWLEDLRAELGLYDKLYGVAAARVAGTAHVSARTPAARSMPPGAPRSGVGGAGSARRS